MKPKLSNGHFHGKAISHREITGFRLIEAVYSPGFKTPEHSHQEAYFCLVLEGTSTQTYGRKTRIRSPLTTVFYPPGEVQSEQFGDSGGRIFSVEISPQQRGRLRESFPAVEPGESREFQGGTLAWLGTRLYRELHQTDQAAPLAIEGLILEMIADASRRASAPSNRRPPSWLRQVKEILGSHFAEGLTLAYLAALVDVHPVYLATAFRHSYGCTVGEYVRQLRIEFACREVSTSDTPLVEIALAAGFSNQSHFSRTFKRLTGLTPAAYRSAFCFS